MGKKLNTRQYKKRCRVIHNNKFNYDKTKFKTTRENVIVTCPLHGDFEQNANHHLRGIGCPKCKTEVLRNSFISTKDEFVRKANIVHSNAFDYSLFDYINSWTKGKITCTNCQTVFEQHPNSHLNGRACPVCKSSRGEKFLLKIFQKHNINFVKEYKIPGTNYLFRYDFYLPDHNLLIEFHGIQHFKAREFFGGEEALKDTQRRDIFKKELAKLARINIIYFTYRHLKLGRKEFENFVISIILKISTMSRFRMEKG